MIVRVITVVLLSVAALTAQTQAPRDPISVGILNLLAKSRASLTVLAQIHRTGDPDGQLNPVQFSIDVGSPSAQIDETNPDGSHTRSVLFGSQRTYSDNRPADTLNSSYVVLPEFDLADELATPANAVDVGQSSPGQVAIRVHTTRTNGLRLPGDVDKTYLVDTTLHQIVAVKSTVVAGIYGLPHELRYSNYQAGVGGISVPTTVAEYLDGEQLWQLTIVSVQ